MKTEKTHFTVAEIDKQAQALMDEDGAIQTFERRPLRTALEMLDSISIAGLYSSAALIRFLQRGGIPGHAARPSDANNEKLFHTFDLWIDHHASNPMEIAAALVAQVPHMIARAWKRGDSAQDSILKLESAMYQFTARQLEADFQWMEDTATEADPESVDISGDPVIDRVLTWVRDTFPGARMDGIQQPDIPDWLVEPLRQSSDPVKVDPVQDILAQLQHLALNLIQVTELEKAGVRDGSLLPTRWTEDGHYIWRVNHPLTDLANEIAQVVKDFHSRAAEKDRQDDHCADNNSPFPPF